MAVASVTVHVRLSYAQTRVSNWVCFFHVQCVLSALVWQAKARSLTFKLEALDRVGGIGLELNVVLVNAQYWLVAVASQLHFDYATSALLRGELLLYRGVHAVVASNWNSLLLQKLLSRDDLVLFDADQAETF